MLYYNYIHLLMQERQVSQLWKLCYYLKVKNYCKHNNLQVLDKALEIVTNMRMEGKTLGVINYYIDNLYHSANEVVDMTPFEKLKYIT